MLREKAPTHEFWKDVNIQSLIKNIIIWLQILGLVLLESKFCSPPDGLMSLKDEMLGEEYSFSRRVD